MHDEHDWGGNAEPSDISRPAVCPNCQIPARFCKALAEGSNTMTLLEWACPRCYHSMIEVVPLGSAAHRRPQFRHGPARIGTKAGTCLNCGARLQSGPRCPHCKADHAELLELVHTHCGEPPVGTRILALREEGLYRLAIYAVELRLQANLRDGEALAIYGTLLIDLLRPKLAVGVLQAALRHGAPADTHVSLGVALADSGRRREAIDTYERFLADNPEHEATATVLSNIGGCYSHLGQAELGETYHRLAIEADPAKLFPRWNLFANLFGRGRLAEALEVIDQTMGLETLDDAARENLQAYRADVLFRLGRHAEALAAIDASLQSDPGEPNRQMTRAHVLIGLGRHPQARRALLRVLERIPDSDIARELLLEVDPFCDVRPS